MILGLESSCDETALALFDPSSGVSGEWVHSQIAIHAMHGGVVPDLAAREHLQRIPGILEASRGRWLGAPISLVAVTSGPGLAACLALGVAAAKALALHFRVPVTGVNHLRGHAFSPFIPLHAAGPASFPDRMNPMLPHLGLIASGGHTILLGIGAGRRLTRISTTRDDAAGEALDKGAKLLGLGYPGGPVIEELASAGRADAFDFPRAIPRRDDLGFSFSGLKTSLRYRIEDLGAEQTKRRIADLCASYQRAAVDALASKVRVALESGGYRSLGLSGGVGNNRALRASLEEEALRAGIPMLAARPEHSGDNAAMIAFAAWIDPEGATGSGAGLRVEPALGL